MRLPHRRRDLLAPSCVKLAEPREAAAVRMLGEIFLPQQRKRHTTSLQLTLDRRPIDRATLARTGIGNREQPTLLRYAKEGPPLCSSVG